MLIIIFSDILRACGLALLYCINYNAANCFADSSIDAPPSFKPAKKYSDLSGLPVCNCHVTSNCCQFLNNRDMSIHKFVIVILELMIFRYFYVHYIKQTLCFKKCGAELLVIKLVSRFWKFFDTINIFLAIFFL